MAAKPNTSDNLLDKLGNAAIERERDRQTPFPPKWDPSNPDHPNPIVMARFPGLQKPTNASSPLIEATHKDGVIYTVWTNENLLHALIRAGVEEGKSCAIRRSAEKHTFYSEKLGRDVDAWQWTVITPENRDAPARGGRLISMQEAARLLEGVEHVSEGEPELVPDAIEASASTDTGDGIPF